MASIFFSYSHRDEDLRDELEVHLAALKRQRVIDTWHDRRIGAGHDFAKVIDEHLEQADVILLLVSPYFIASDYCYDVEMTRAVERHEQRGARVIPVILHPCDWHQTPFGHLLAVPKDGKPVTKYPNPHDAFLEIVQAVKAAVADLAPSQPKPVAEATPISATVQEVIRSSNLRIKKQFSDRERDSFLDDSFEYMAKLFEGSLEELSRRNSEIETNFRRIDANTFDAAIYRNGKAVGQCQIRIEGNFGGGSAGIAYSNDGRRGGYNEMLHVVDGANALFLKPMGMFHLGKVNEQLSQQGAAEYYWSRLIQSLQQ